MRNRLSSALLSHARSIDGRWHSTKLLPLQRWLSSGSIKPDKGPKYFGLYGPPVHLHNEEEAKVLVHSLSKAEKSMLLDALEDCEEIKERRAKNNIEILTSESSENGALPITGPQLRSLFLVNTLPFIGFGLLDNIIMILAGEYIDVTLGITFSLSTMAAAGLGNIISDVAGVGSAHYVEFLVSKFGITPPALTPEQWDTGKARWTSNLGRTVGLIVGCLIGMFPLLFFDESEKHAIKHHNKQTDQEQK